MIRVVHPGSGSWFFTHPGSRGQKGRHRIPDPDPQHWFHLFLTQSLPAFFKKIFLFAKAFYDSVICSYELDIDMNIMTHMYMHTYAYKHPGVVDPHWFTVKPGCFILLHVFYSCTTVYCEDRMLICCICIFDKLSVVTGTLPTKRRFVHCNKRLAVFPSPAGMSLTNLSLAGNN